MQSPDAEALAARALELYRTRKCPHCGNKITLWEALSMVFGSAWHYYVKVRRTDGKEMFWPIKKVNPQNMVIVHPDEPPPI